MTNVGITTPLDSKKGIVKLNFGGSLVIFRRSVLEGKGSCSILRRGLWEICSRLSGTTVFPAIQMAASCLMSRRLASSTSSTAFFAVLPSLRTQHLAMARSPATTYSTFFNTRRASSVCRENWLLS
ncbi:unnamed protein product [Ectocarpus sp. 12 AP-2014]